MSAKQAEPIEIVWSGKNKKGAAVKGEMSAASINEAKNILRRRGIAVSKIKKAPQPLFGMGAKIEAQDICNVSRQIATMLSAGVTLIQTLEMIAKEHDKPPMRKMLNEITNQVQSGNPLSSSLRKFPDYFEDLYCDLVKTGEQSGALEDIYDRIATYKEKAEALKSKIKKAMFYPIAVVVVAFIVTTILLIFVVPQFEEIFKGFGAELPAFTQFVLGISKGMQEYGPLLAAGGVVFFFLFKRAYKNSQKLRDILDAKILKVPVVGAILVKASIARFTRTLSTTFAAGVPLIESLESAAGASGNAVYRDAIRFMKAEVSGGEQMNVAMRSTNVFPPMVVQMVAIGEESGSVDSMLAKIAIIYEREVDDMVDGLTSLLEPLIMAVLGVVIGGLIVAMYLPIFQMGMIV